MEACGKDGRPKYWISEGFLLYLHKLPGMLGTTLSCDIKCSKIFDIGK